MDPLINSQLLCKTRSPSLGRREVLGMDIGPSEAETFWTAFLRKLARRGLRGVKLVVSDAHEGEGAQRDLAALPCALHAQRARSCREARRDDADADAAKAQGRRVADQLRPRSPSSQG